MGYAASINVQPPPILIKTFAFLDTIKKECYRLVAEEAPGLKRGLYEQLTAIGTYLELITTDSPVQDATAQDQESRDQIPKTQPTPVYKIPQLVTSMLPPIIAINASSLVINALALSSPISIALKAVVFYFYCRIKLQEWLLKTTVLTNEMAEHAKRHMQQGRFKEQAQLLGWNYSPCDELCLPGSINSADDYLKGELKALLGYFIQLLALLGLDMITPYAWLVLLPAWAVLNGQNTLELALSERVCADHRAELFRQPGYLGYAASILILPMIALTTFEFIVWYFTGFDLYALDFSPLLVDVVMIYMAAIGFVMPIIRKEDFENSLQTRQEPFALLRDNTATAVDVIGPYASAAAKAMAKLFFANHRQLPPSLMRTIVRRIIPSSKTILTWGAPNVLSDPVALARDPILSDLATTYLTHLYGMIKSINDNKDSYMVYFATLLPRAASALLFILKSLPPQATKTLLKSLANEDEKTALEILTGQFHDVLNQIEQQRFRDSCKVQASTDDVKAELELALKGVTVEITEEEKLETLLNEYEQITQPRLDDIIGGYVDVFEQWQQLQREAADAVITEVVDQNALTEALSNVDGTDPTEADGMADASHQDELDQASGFVLLASNTARQAHGKETTIPPHSTNRLTLLATPEKKKPTSDNRSEQDNERLAHARRKLCNQT